MALQRSIGNRATAAALLGRSVLHRFKEKSYEGLDPVAAVRKALAEGSQWDAHELMRRLETKEQANTVLKDYKMLATSCFGNDTIATAADILVRKGGRLGLAIDWMVAEGTNWKLLSARHLGCVGRREEEGQGRGLAEVLGRAGSATRRCPSW